MERRIRQLQELRCQLINKGRKSHVLTSGLGGRNHGYCEHDGATAACPLSCDACPEAVSKREPQTYDLLLADCRPWRLR
jgi:hypothetical protein